MSATTATSRSPAVIVFFSITATLLVGLRAVSRFAILKRACLDDYFCIISLFFSWAIAAMCLIELPLGLGQHIYYLSAEQIVGQIKCVYIIIPIHNVGISFIKLSALFQFLRFFASPRTRIITWTLIFIVSSYAIVVPMILFFQCHPIAAFWDKSIEGARCLDFAAVIWSTGSLNLTIDIAIVALPMYVLKDLRIPKRQKWAILGIFAIATLTCVAAGLRLYVVSKAIRSQDFTYYNLEAILWAHIELNTAIVCACMPALRPLMSRILPEWLSLSGSTPTSNGHTSSSSYNHATALLHLRPSEQISQGQKERDGMIL